jgi:uncharacterized protein YecT (DUF1311 family)
MNRFRVPVLLALPVFICVWTSVLAEEPPEILYSNVDGSCRIERDGEKAWVISAKDSSQRAELPPLEGISPFDDEFHASPNAEWIFGVRKTAHGFSSGDLFHRADSQHFEMAPEHKESSFNDLVWPFCVKEKALKANYSAEEGGADVGMTSFVAWSLDSGRLLVQLRGGNRHKAFQECYVYFNTRTKAFEMTNYLRNVNKTKGSPLACAEPPDVLPSAADLKTRLDSLDRQLNKKYADVLAQTNKDRAGLVREAQRKWIKQRDDGAKLYVSSFPASESESRRLQFLGDVTSARIEVPAEEWEQ